MPSVSQYGYGEKKVEKIRPINRTNVPISIDISRQVVYNLFTASFRQYFIRGVDDMRRCQFCYSTEKVHDVGGIFLCQKCMLAVYEYMKNSPPKEEKHEKEKYKIVN